MDSAHDRNSWATFLTMVLILISGNPVLSGRFLAAIVLILLIIFAAIKIKSSAEGSSRGKSFSNRYILITSVFLIVFVGQYIKFGVISWAASIYVLVKMLVGGFLVHRIGGAFPLRFLQATYLLSIPALVGYFALLLLGPDRFPTLFPETLVGNNVKSLLFITALTTSEWWRNSGPMWEPGAFQCIINLALLLAPTQQLIDRRYRKRLFVLLVALLTTFSTTGYLALFLVVMYKILRSNAKRKLKWLLAPLFMFLATCAYFQIDFLGQKIAVQIDNSQLNDEFSSSRFGALQFDLYYISKSPLIGNGLLGSTRFADHPELEFENLGHGNGLSNFVASLGLACFAAYLLGLATSGFARQGVLDLLALVILIMVLSFGEQFLLYPLFLGLPFLAAPISLHKPQRTRPFDMQNAAITTTPLRSFRTEL